MSNDLASDPRHQNSPVWIAWLGCGHSRTVSVGGEALSAQIPVGKHNWLTCYECGADRQVVAVRRS